MSPPTTPLHLRPAAWVRAYLEHHQMSDAQLGAKVWPGASPVASKERIRSMRRGGLGVGFQGDVARALNVDGEQFYWSEKTRESVRRAAAS